MKYLSNCAWPDGVVGGVAQRASIDDLWDHPWMDGPTLNDAELAAAMDARHKVVVVIWFSIAAVG